MRGPLRELREGSYGILMEVRTVEREKVQMDAIFMKIVGWNPSISISTPASGNFIEVTYNNSSGAASSLKSFFSKLATGGSSSNTATAKAIRQEQIAQE